VEVFRHHLTDSDVFVHHLHLGRLDATCITMAAMPWRAVAARTGSDDVRPRLSLRAERLPQSCVSC
jgi:hypothetical protein